MQKRPTHARRRWITAHFALLLVSTLGAASVRAQEFDHIAVTEGPALEQGSVATGAEVWQCRGDRCETRTRTASLSVGACAKIAARVGPIESFGPAKGKPFGAADLASCNASARRNVTGSVGGATPPGPSRASPAPAPIPQLPQDRLVVEFAGGPVVLGPGDTWPFSWYCSERTCISNIVDRMPSVGDCRDLNLKTSFRIVSVTSPRGRFSADDVRVCNKPEVIALEFIIGTGRDGIREQSNLQFMTATRRDPAGTVHPSRVHFREGVGDRRTVAKRLPMSELSLRPHQLALEDLRSITLRFWSGSTGAAFEQGDQWDLAALTIRAHMQAMDGSTYTKDIYRLEGPPHHFDSDDSWEIPFSAPVFGE